MDAPTHKADPLSTEVPATSRPGPLPPHFFVLLPSHDTQSNINGVPLEIPGRAEYFLPASPHPLRYPFEGHLYTALEAVVGEGDTVIDVGATTGILAALLATRVGSAGRIHTFEANPEFARDALEMLTRNGLEDRVELNAVCVSDQSGESVDFYVLPGMLRTNSSRNPEACIGQARFDRITATTVSLDDYFRDVQAAPSCAVIDVEGAEFSVLEGAQQLIDDHHPHLFIETHGGAIDSIQGSLPDLCHWLEARDYALFDLLQGECITGSDYAARYPHQIGYLMASTRLGDAAFVHELSERHAREQEIQACLSASRDELAAANSRLSEGEPRAALEGALHCAEKYPWHPDVHELLARCLRETDAPPTATVEAYGAAVSHTGDAFWIHYNLGTFLLSQDQPAAARASLDAALALRPWHREARQQWVSALSSETREQVREEAFAQAVPNLRLIREIEPERSEWAYLLAFSLQREYFPLDQVLDLYQEALDLGQDPFWVHYNRSFAFKDHGRLEEALEDLRLADEAQPGKAEVGETIASIEREKRSARDTRDSDPALQRQRQLITQIRAMAVAREGKADILILPIIDWHFRIQRPQHIARCLGAMGHRVFYLATTFIPNPDTPGFTVLSSPADNVFVCQLHCPEPQPSIGKSNCSPETSRALASSIDVLRREMNVEAYVTLAQHPFWQPISRSLQGTVTVYDCMDHHAGFSGAGDAVATNEVKLFEESDLVVTTSEALSEKVGAHVQNAIVRNAGQIDHFSRRPTSLALEPTRPLVGYYGAIASWFDMELVVAMARRFPEWDFLLVGDTLESETREARSLANVRFTGEIGYEELPRYLYAFDVCLIPFQITELTRCTDPVKIYEYLSAGKPVVATAMQELKRLGDLVYLAENEDEFALQLERAMKDRDNEALAHQRAEWARQQTWEIRTRDLWSAIEGSCPRVSIVILTHNQLEVTQACLQTVATNSHYRNLELLLVDNGSTDGTPDHLEDYARAMREQHGWTVEVLLNDENLGFAAGNNVGISAASGDVVVILNNDTCVTRGWVHDLVRHFEGDPSLGLVGPVTNNIGNEAKIDIEYSSPDEMESAARRYTLMHARELLPIERIAFFCVAISRAVIEEVGLLDEAFGIGFFEDDDYCMRVSQAGYKIGIAEDVFVHHALSASFNTLEQTRRNEIFDRSKQIFEQKWGEWKPHQYRRPLQALDSRGEGDSK